MTSTKFTSRFVLASGRLNERMRTRNLSRNPVGAVRVCLFGETSKLRRVGRSVCLLTLTNAHPKSLGGRSGLFHTACLDHTPRAAHRLHLQHMAALEQDMNSLKTQARENHAQIGELKQKEVTTAAALTKQVSEYESAKERISNTQGETLILSFPGKHNYASNFPSPADLVRQIASTQDRLYVEWITKALETPTTAGWQAHMRPRLSKTLGASFFKCWLRPLMSAIGASTSVFPGGSYAEKDACRSSS